jgi:CopG family nickel-responsive transcriptional regulator
MQRMTISIDDDLAQAWDELIAARHYSNRSEAFRDMLRRELAEESLARAPKGDCVATLSYTYDHHDRTTTFRLLDKQHDNHDLALASMHAHLEHDRCIEVTILRGPAHKVERLAKGMLAERGVKDGKLHFIR